MTWVMFNTEYFRMLIKPTTSCCTITAPEISRVTVDFSHFLNRDFNRDPDGVGEIIFLIQGLSVLAVLVLVLQTRLDLYLERPACSSMVFNEKLLSKYRRQVILWLSYCENWALVGNEKQFHLGLSSLVLMSSQRRSLIFPMVC